MKNKKIIIISFIAFCLLCGITTHVFAKDKENIKKEEQIVKKETKIKTITKIKFDIKGAVKNPGVYELEKGKMIIDAIKIAGGLLNNGTTDNINLSKKIENEMAIIIYTKQEINAKEKQIAKECKCNDIDISSCTKNKQSIVKSNEKAKNNTTATSSEENSNSLVSINTATKEELMTLNGIGEAKALNIIDYRNTNGEFKDINELKNVTGIGESIFEKIKDNIKL